MKCFIFFLLFYNALDLNNQKILWLPSIFQFDRKLGFWTTLRAHQDSKSFRWSYELLLLLRWKWWTTIMSHSAVNNFTILLHVWYWSGRHILSKIVKIAPSIYLYSILFFSKLKLHDFLCTYEKHLIKQPQRDSKDLTSWFKSKFII